MRNSPTPPGSHRLLSQTAEHALRAALFLGRREPGDLVSATAVAEALGTPPNYTAKTMRKLKRHGLLRSARGPSGGFALSVEPREISMARIVAAVDEVAPPHSTCLLGDRRCDAGSPCGAHRRWTEVNERVSGLLEQTTLADLLQDEGRRSR